MRLLRFQRWWSYELFPWGHISLRWKRRPCHVQPDVGAAMGALASLTADGLFIGQSPAFFEFMRELAANADAAQREQ